MLGEADRPAPAQAVEQRRAHDPLQRGDLLADRGLRVAEQVRRGPERAVLGDRSQG